MLAYKVVPRFAGARKWRNKTLAPILFGLCLAAGVFQFFSWLATQLERWGW